VNNKNIISNIFKNNVTTSVPIWFLRQAGRHIPEYFSIRSQANNFIDFCLDTNLIVESTKLPLKYYNIDAAIVFSDILMIPWAMNRNVIFTKNIGPTMEPMVPDETKIMKNVNIANLLRPLENAIKILRKDIPSSICLIGFSGAPWTLACYMIEGRSSKDFINTRTALWRSNKWFQELIETLINYITDKLEMQANAGANVLMIFDSWSHMIPNNFYKQVAIDPIAEIIRLLRSRNVKLPIIGFPFKSGGSLIEYSYESNVDCIALDWSVNLDWALRNINPAIVIQGNLDPASLIPNNSPFLLDEVVSILETMKDKRFIFNVGHGLTPDCRIENIEKVINIVKGFKS
jgi:uroporphyrinogen decarboxylase